MKVWAWVNTVTYWQRNTCRYSQNYTENSTLVFMTKKSAKENGDGRFGNARGNIWTLVSFEIPTPAQALKAAKARKK